MVSASERPTLLDRASAVPASSFAHPFVSHSCVSSVLRRAGAHAGWLREASRPASPCRRSDRVS